MPVDRRERIKREKNPHTMTKWPECTRQVVSNQAHAPSAHEATSHMPSLLRAAFLARLLLVPNEHAVWRILSAGPASAIGTYIDQARRKAGIGLKKIDHNSILAMLMVARETKSHTIAAHAI